MKFLTQIAHLLTQKHPTSLADTLLIVPNLQIVKFLQQEISAILQTGYLLPEVTTLDLLVQKSTKKNTIDPLKALLEFYGIYKNVLGGPTIQPGDDIEKAQQKDLDSFMKWAPSLLHDFNEIDAEQIKAIHLLNTVNEYKQYDGWSPEGKKQKKYLDFWEKIPTLYADYTTHLASIGEYYQGQIYKEYVENIEKHFTDFAYENMYCIGLDMNILHKSQRSIIQYFNNRKKAIAYWDIHPDFVAPDNYLEAGHFYQKYSTLLTHQKELHEVYKNYTAAKDIAIHACNHPYAELQKVNTIISQLPAEELKDTVLLIPNSYYLIPLLTSIPESIPAFNISLGYKMANNPLFSLIDSIWNLQQNAQKLADIQNRNFGFHYQDILNVLKQPFIYTHFPDYMQEVCREIIIFIETQKSPFLTGSKIRKIFSDRLEFMHYETIHFWFELWREKTSNIPHYLAKIIKIVIEYEQQKKEENFDKEYIYALTQLLQKIINSVTAYPISLSLKNWYNIWNSFLKNTHMSFLGEGTTNLQIMDFEHLQGLDFKNVIVVGMNEGVFPEISTLNSFISLPIRNDYAMSSYKNKDATQAYQFYHMLQHATNIHLCYSGIIGEKVAEKSRYVQQLLKEQQPNNWNIHEYIESNFIVAPIGKPITIQKTPTIIDGIKRILYEKGISPTSGVKSVLTCHLQFYFQQVMELKIQDTIEEDVAANILGNVVHFVLEKLYLPYRNEYITIPILHTFAPLVPALITEAFIKNKMDIERLQVGKSYLSKEIAKRFVLDFITAEVNFLEKEAPNQRLQIVWLEQHAKPEIVLLGIHSLKLKGVIDRVDRVGEIIRIVDYKTSNIKLVKDRPDYKQQVLTYGLILKSKPFFQKAKQVQAIIISLPQQQKYKVFSKNIQEDLPEYEQELTLALDQLVDANTPIIGTDKIEACKYCDYKKICRK